MTTITYEHRKAANDFADIYPIHLMQTREGVWNGYGTERLAHLLATREEMVRAEQREKDAVEGWERLKERVASTPDKAKVKRVVLISEDDFKAAIREQE